MSFALMCFSEYGCQELVLPKLNNQNYTVTFDHNLLGLMGDLELYFDVIGEQWKLLGVSENAAVSAGTSNFGQEIKSGAAFRMTVGTVKVAVVIIEFNATIDGMEKYVLPVPGQVSFGSEPDNTIVCRNNAFVSRHHAVLSVDGNGCIVTDNSTNGVFVNGRRVQGNFRLNYGDCISLFGIQIIWLGRVIAIGCKSGSIDIKLEKNIERTPKQAVALSNSNSEKQYFRRSPRNLPKLHTEPIEIESPPQPQRTSKRPLILTIGPSLTMALPMIAGTGVAVFASRSTGANSGTFMYTGIIIAVLSALIGAIWALVNVRYSKKQETQSEAIRVEKYGEYLKKVESEIDEKYKYNKQSLEFTYPSARECSRFDQNNSSLWSRNYSHQDFLFFRLGVGALPFHCAISVPAEKFTLIDDELAEKPRRLYEKYRIMKDVPVGIDLFGKKLVGVVSQDKERRAAILRNIVVQAAANTCYTDVKMVFLFDGRASSEVDAWSFARWLPHTWSADHKLRYFAATENERSEVCFSLANTLRLRAEQDSAISKTRFKPYYIVFVANPDFLEGEPVAKYLLNKDQSLDVTTVLFAESFEQLPNGCVDIIRYDNDFCGTLNTEQGDESWKAISFDELRSEEADTFARTISSIEVRETESGGDIPESLSFLDMYQAASVKELNVPDRWIKNRTYENMRVPIGQKAGGEMWYLDIHEKYHGPHGLVAGTTGSGKSETLQTYILSLAVNFSPDDVAFFLIDFKGGGMANLFANLPHTAGSISNLSGNQIQRAMISLKSEIRRRQKIFGDYGINHIDQYTRLVKNKDVSLPIPHLFIVIDEFAELKRDQPDFMRELISVAQVGRSLGIHLILATQKPSGTVDDNIWSNTRFKLCLRVQDRQDSNDVLHKPDAAYLTQAGRCYMQVGNDEIYELFQSAWSGAVYIDDPEAAKTDIANVWSNTGRSAISGTVQKVKQLEQSREGWLRVLCSSIAETAAEEGIVGDSSDVEAPEFIGKLYQKIKLSGYDYPVSTVNTNKLTEIAHLFLREGKGTAVSASGIAKIAKMMGNQLPEYREKTQLAAIVDYIAKLSRSQNRRDSFQLWCPLLPQNLRLADFCTDPVFDGKSWPSPALDGALSATIGMYDDPANQRQDSMIVNLTEDGNLAVCGSAVTGKSTLLQTLLYSFVTRYTPDQLNIYAIDFSNHMLSPFSELPHTGGIVYDNELDKVEKLFVLISNIVSQRKEMFLGGSYAQFVRANGRSVPNIILVIDNYTSFREKTEDVYESNLISLSREGANYGIYLVVSAGGFGSAEIQNRIADNFRSVLCLEMGDRYKYSEVLRLPHVDVYPEGNVKGRGLAEIGGRVLEFQTALPLSAADDYERLEKLKAYFAEMAKEWKGKRARSIPSIPADPSWTDFLNYEENANVNETIRSGRLPFAWNEKDASVESIDLSKNYCWMINGRPRSGRKNLLKVLAAAAKLTDSQRIVIDFDGNTLQHFATANGARYISSSQELFDMLKELIPVFSERNRRKHDLISSGKDEAEVFSGIQAFTPVFIFVNDLVQFMKAVYNPAEGVGNMAGFVENIVEKGFMHNIYFFAVNDPAKASDAIAYRAYNLFLSYKTGIHLGGNVAGQRLFDFSSLPYSDQSKPSRPGMGLLPANEYNLEIRSVVIPFMKG